MKRKIELLVENYQIDLFGDESFTATYSNSEIVDVGVKSGSYTKEINIPASKNNIERFTNLFDVNVEGGFNPISRKTATLFIDSVAVFQGYFQLTSVNIKENEYVTFKGLLFDENINFVQALDEFYLENLVIPVTGTTTTYGAPYTLESTFQLTGFNSYNIGSFSAKYTLTGNDYVDSIYFTGITFSSGSWLTIGSDAHSIDETPNNVTWTQPVTTLIATDNIRVKLGGTIFIGFVSSTIKKVKTLKMRIIKTNTAGVDIILGTYYGKYTGINFRVYTILLTGEKLRLEIDGVIPNINLSVLPETQIGGVIETITEMTTDDYTINFDTIFDTYENVESSDDGILTYPIIDYNKSYSFANKPINNIISNAKNTLFINIEDIRPSVFIKPVWDAIFEQAGFTYTSDFLNSDLFKKLIIVGGVQEDADKSLIYHSTVKDLNSPTGYLCSVPDSIQYDAIETDIPLYYYYGFEFDGGQLINQTTVTDLTNVELTPTGATKPFKLVTAVEAYTTIIPSYVYEYEYAHQNIYLGGQPLPSPIIGSYRYYGYVEQNSDINRRGMFITAAEDGLYEIDASVRFTAFVPRDYSITATPRPNVATKFTLSILKLSRGSYKYFPSDSISPQLDDGGWTYVKKIEVDRLPNSSNQEFTIPINEKLQLQKGDMVKVLLFGNTFDTTIGQWIIFNADEDATYLKGYKLGSSYNSIVTNAATFLPKGFKQRDFILGISRLFNLYFEPSLDNKNNLIIEPRNDYYAKGKILDWSKKVDYTNDLNINIISHDFPKTNIFKFKNDDKDYLSTNYANYVANNKIFGTYEYISPNEYKVDETTLESIFAPSYTQQVDNTNVKITRILNPELFEPDYDGGKVEYKVEPRILFYSKRDNITEGYNIYMTDIKQLPEELETINDGDIITLLSTIRQITEYGTASHLDDVDNPTNDLNWYTDFNYLPNTTLTTNNLFNKYYKEQIIELSDQTARKLTCNVFLSPVDIANLRFNDIYYLNNDYWRLIEITDYDSSADVLQSTKCTFVKIVKTDTSSLINYSAQNYINLKGGSAGGLLQPNSNTIE